MPIENLKVTESLSLSPRKTLYIVETDGERFLIAGDADRTTLISRLDYKNKTLFSIFEKFNDL